MAVSTNDLKNGMTLDLPEGLFSVVEFQHVKPGKGGAFVRTKLKNVRTGAVVERTYRADEKLEQAIIDKREMQFLYRDGAEYVFMDTSTYEQLQVPPAALGDAASYLKETDEAVLQLYDGEIVGVDLPAAVELAVTDTEPGMQGDRVSGARKPATLQTGLVVQVPLFVNSGDVIKVDTRTGEYLTRACGPRTISKRHRRAIDGHGGAPCTGGARVGALWRAMTERHQSRERALSLLYEAELKGDTPASVVAALPVAPDPFARALVDGAEAHRSEADALIAEASVGWPLDRMAVVDRLVLRLAVAELLDPAGPPVAVVIDEAVELAKTYSTEESGGFVNGVLSTVAAKVR